jgi:hypothetical protein
MFPSFNSDGASYTVTLTNISSETVHGIVLNGRHENDWSIFYYPRCLFADADADGWNDSLEHSMANLLYPNGYIDGVFQPDLLWGSNYLRGQARTAVSLDEIDSMPPDLDDNGQIDSEDLRILSEHLGEGNGIALEAISPNPGEAWFHNNTLPWRRYDLDGDGYVGEEDLRIVEQSMGLDGDTGVDRVAPTARVLAPVENQAVTRGEYQLIQGHAWDNAAIAQVEYRVNGRTICSHSDPVPTFAYTSPFYSCWWKVPRRSSTYILEINVLDAEGNIGSSHAVTVSSS